MLDESGREVGMLELDFREPASASSPSSAWSPSCPARATAAGCSPKPCGAPGATASNRVHVHTCSLDHPAALAAYRRAGFIALQARDRALPRSAPARHPADATARLRSRCSARRLSVRRCRPAERRSARASPQRSPVNAALDELADERDEQRADTVGPARRRRTMSSARPPTDGRPAAGRPRRSRTAAGSRTAATNGRASAPSCAEGSRSGRPLSALATGDGISMRRSRRPRRQHDQQQRSAERRRCVPGRGAARRSLPTASSDERPATSTSTQPTDQDRRRA